jgi:hypothetical protein
MFSVRLWQNSNNTLQDYVTSVWFFGHRPLRVYPERSEGPIHRSVLYSAIIQIPL